MAELTITHDYSGAEDYSVTVTVEYPEGEGFSAINSLREAGSNTTLAALIRKLEGDPSIEQALAAMSEGGAGDEE